MKKTISLFLLFFLVFSLFGCTQKEDPPVPDDTPTAQELYDAYFAVDQKPTYTESIYTRVPTTISHEYGQFDVVKRSNPQEILYTCKHGNYGNWLFVDQYFLYMDSDQSIKQVDLETKQEYSVYQGQSLTVFKYTSNEIAYFLDGITLVRLHLQSGIADNIYVSDRDTGVSVITNNTVVVSTRSDRILTDGSGDYARDYFYIYIPTGEITEISEDDARSALTGEYP